MTTRTRHIETYRVDTVTFSDDGTYGTVSTTDHTSFSQPAAIAKKLNPGGVFDLETTGGSIITGIRVGGEWILRKSDADLDADLAAFVAKVVADRRESLEKNRPDWQARQDALPDWGRVRLERFHARGGEAFALDGWGYELTVVELAALYEANGGLDNDDITAYANTHGTSGNQHDCAKALATIVRTGQWETRGYHFPAALTPLTGDPDYSKAAAKHQEQNTALAASE